MVASYAPLMMQYGLVCEPEAQYITTQMNTAQLAIQHNDYVMSKNVSDLGSVFEYSLQTHSHFPTSQIWDTIMGDYYENVTGGSDSYNILRTEVYVPYMCCCLFVCCLLILFVRHCINYAQEPEDFGYYNLLWEKDDIRRGIHVGNLTYNQGGKVADKLSLVGL